MESKYRIRKLTEREHWRLMDISDADFEKAQAINSKTQLYAQSGNAICRCVLMAIFSQMHIQDIAAWNDMSYEQIYELLERSKDDTKRE